MKRGEGPIRKRFAGKRPGAGGPGKPVDKEKEALRLDKLLHDHNAKTGGNTEIYNKKKETYIAEQQMKKKDSLDDELMKFMTRSLEAQPAVAKIEKKPSEKKEEEAPKAAEEPATQTLEVTKKRSSVTKREVTQTK